MTNSVHRVALLRVFDAGLMVLSLAIEANVLDLTLHAAAFTAQGFLTLSVLSLSEEEGAWMMGGRATV